jgi:uncharacterized protein (TIGR00251 family)
MTSPPRPPATGEPGDASDSARKDDGTALPLWIQPRAAKDALVGERDGMVVIRLQAPPVDGAANAALIRFLARRLGCPASAVRLLRGERGRRKWVEVDGFSAAELRRRLLELSDS